MEDKYIFCLVTFLSLVIGYIFPEPVLLAAFFVWLGDTGTVMITTQSMWNRGVHLILTSQTKVVSDHVTPVNKREEIYYLASQQNICMNCVTNQWVVNFY
jgi:hypothetical protein